MGERTSLEFMVTLHTEGVDRNEEVETDFVLIEVTLHTEGVDRN